MNTQKHFPHFVKLSTLGKCIEQRIERFDSPVATKIRYSEKGLESAVGEAGTGVEGDDIAEDDFGRREAGFLIELVENLLHCIKHLGAAKLGDDEVVGEEGVAKRLRGIRVRVLEELES
jgi:hypothetical protein